MASSQKRLFSLCQPPPKIPDKHLDEREHTVEEWKGRTAHQGCERNTEQFFSHTQV